LRRFAAKIELRHSKIKSKIKSKFKSKGSGQECPLHTSDDDPDRHCVVGVERIVCGVADWAGGKVYYLDGFVLRAD
jgi:hypothetical protein